LQVPARIVSGEKDELLDFSGAKILDSIMTKAEDWIYRE